MDSILPSLTDASLSPAPLATAPSPNGPPVVHLPPRRRYVGIAWLMILLSIATIIGINASEIHRAASEAGNDRVQFELVGRFVYGYFRWGGDSMTRQNRDDLIKTLEDSAKTRLDQVRLAIIIAEMRTESVAFQKINPLLLPDQPRDEAWHEADLLRTIYARGPDAITASDRQGFIDREGWFARLALSHRRGDSDSNRQIVLNEAQRTFYAWVSAGVAGLVMLGIGLVLLIILLVKWNDGAFSPRFRPADFQTSDILLESFAVYLGLMTLLFVAMLFFAARLVNSPFGLWVNLLLVVPVAAALLWIQLRGVSWIPFIEATGLHRGQGFFKELSLGIIGYVAGLPVIAVGIIISVILSHFLGEGPGHPIVREIQQAGAIRVFLFILACIFAPMTEELMFRGMLLGHLRRRHGWLLSVALVSLIFAAIHPQGWTAVPVLASVAVILGALREQRESLIAPIAAHALNNFSILLLLILAIG